MTLSGFFWGGNSLSHGSGLKFRNSYTATTLYDLRVIVFDSALFCFVYVVRECFQSRVYNIRYNDGNLNNFHLAEYVEYILKCK